MKYDGGGRGKWGLIKLKQGVTSTKSKPKQRMISMILLIPVFCTISRKSIIGKQDGQGGGKWGLINLRQQSRKREKVVFAMIYTIIYDNIR